MFFDLTHEVQRLNAVLSAYQKKYPTVTKEDENVSLKLMKLRLLRSKGFTKSSTAFRQPPLLLDSPMHHGFPIEGKVRP